MVHRVAATRALLLISALPVPTAGAAVGEALPATPVELGLWPTPPGMSATCSTVYTSSVGKYTLPYRVDFGEGGSFKWWAPIRAGGTEVGKGIFLSEPQYTVTEDGAWQVGYFSANRFTPNPGNITNCCCEYVGSPGPGMPRVLADYCQVVKDSVDLPMQQVCASVVVQCPRDNATAARLMGTPFIEIYSPCVPLGIVANSDMWVSVLLVAGMVLLGLLAWAMKGCWACRRRVEGAEEGYHAMDAKPSRVGEFFKPVHAQPRPVEDVLV